jgi:hypothetical protein
LSAHSLSTLAIAFSRDGLTLATGGGDNMIRTWRVSDGAQLQTLSGHTFFVSSLSFNPAGRFLASSELGRNGEDLAHRRRSAGAHVDGSQRHRAVGGVASQRPQPRFG